MASTEITTDNNDVVLIARTGSDFLYAALVKAEKMLGSGDNVDTNGTCANYNAYSTVYQDKGYISKGKGKRSRKEHIYRR